MNPVTPAFAPLTVDAQDRILQYVWEVGERRVAALVARCLSEEQLQFFEACLEAGDACAAFALLESAWPEYPRRRREEFDKVAREVVAQAPGIVAIELALADCRDNYAARFASLDDAR